MATEVGEGGGEGDGGLTGKYNYGAGTHTLEHNRTQTFGPDQDL